MQSRDSTEQVRRGSRDEVELSLHGGECVRVELGLNQGVSRVLRLIPRFRSIHVIFCTTRLGFWNHSRLAIHSTFDSQYTSWSGPAQTSHS
jgi:hypothetical protein